MSERKFTIILAQGLILFFVTGLCFWISIVSILNGITKHEGLLVLIGIGLLIVMALVLYFWIRDEIEESERLMREKEVDKR